MVCRWLPYLPLATDGGISASFERVGYGGGNFARYAAAPEPNRMNGCFSVG
jgi:hypothetical protein